MQLLQHVTEVAVDRLTGLSHHWFLFLPGTFGHGVLHACKERRTVISWAQRLQDLRAQDP